MNYFGDQKLIVTSIDEVVHVDTLRDSPKLVHKNRWCYGLVYKLRGKVVYNFRRRTMDFSPGCVCMLPKGSDYTVDTIEPGECIAINFNLLDDPPLDPFSECFRAAPKLETLFRKLDNQRLRAFAYNDYGMMASLYEIIQTMDKASRYSHLTPAAELRLRNIVSAIQQGYPNPALSLSALAEAEGVPMSSMREAFLKIFGMPPVRYLTALRLTEAKKLLNESDLNIEQVAQRCGFADQFYFSRVFKRNCGVSPSEFRKISMMNI